MKLRARGARQDRGRCCRGGACLVGAEAGVTAAMAGEWDGGGGSLGLLSRTAEPAHLTAGKTRTRKVRLDVKKRPLVSVWIT